MTKEFASPQALLDAVGTDLGTTDWVTITQEQINKFAEATLDNQWIHVDTERAKAGPFGAPIAHGYLTMSLSAYFLGQLVRVSGISMGINYGADNVLAARTKEQLDSVADDIRAMGRRALVIPCDVNENEAVEDIVAQAMNEFGRIDVVVNNAGGSMPRPFMNTSAGYLERAFH